MNRSDILKALDTEIERLQEARTLLADSPETFFEPTAVRRGPGRPKGSGSASNAKAKPTIAKRTMSAEGRARIAAAQKKRWATLHKTQTPPSPAKKQSAKPVMAKKSVKKTAAKKTAAKKTVEKKAAKQVAA